MTYSNLSKQLGPKKALEALSRIKEIKDRKSDAKKGVDLVALAKKFAENKLEGENDDSEEE